MMLRCRFVRSLQLFSSSVWGAVEMVLDRPCFRASTRPQHAGPNNKNKHPGVELVPQCEDLNEEHVELPRHTVRGNPIPHSLFFSPFLLPSPLSPILSCSLSFASLSSVFLNSSSAFRYSVLVRRCQKFLMFVQNCLFFPPYCTRTSDLLSVSRKNTPALFLPDTAYTLELHPLSSTCFRAGSIHILLGHAMQYAHKETWEERGLSPPIRPDRRSQSFFHVLNSSLPSTWIN